MLPSQAGAAWLDAAAAWLARQPGGRSTASSLCNKSITKIPLPPAGLAPRDLLPLDARFAHFTDTSAPKGA